MGIPQTHQHKHDEIDESTCIIHLFIFRTGHSSTGGTAYCVFARSWEGPRCLEKEKHLESIIFLLYGLVFGDVHSMFVHVCVFHVVRHCLGLPAFSSVIYGSIPQIFVYDVQT